MLKIFGRLNLTDCIDPFVSPSASPALILQTMHASDPFYAEASSRLEDRGWEGQIAIIFSNTIAEMASV